MTDLDAIAAPVWADLAHRTRGIFCDLDDTLTEHGVLVPAAYAALASLRAAGLRAVIVTGRPLGWAEVLASIFPIDAAVAENGAVAALPGGRRIYFESDEARAAGSVHRAEARRRVASELPAVQHASDQSLREIDLAFDIAERARLDEPTIAALDALLRDCSLRTTRSSIHLHGTFSAGSKASMAVRIGAALWSEDEATVRDDYLFVGDSPNDAPAFAFFPRSIGVANVRAHLPRLVELGAEPWAVTRRPSGHGFADVVARLLGARTTT